MTAEKTCDTCSDTGCSGQLRRPNESDQEFLDRRALESRMCRIEHKVMVLSGKGGVGRTASGDSRPCGRAPQEGGA